MAVLRSTGKYGDEDASIVYIVEMDNAHIIVSSLQTTRRDDHPEARYSHVRLFTGW